MDQIEKIARSIIASRGGDPDGEVAVVTYHTVTRNLGVPGHSSTTVPVHAKVPAWRTVLSDARAAHRAISGESVVTFDAFQEDRLIKRSIERIREIGYKCGEYGQEGSIDEALLLIASVLESLRRRDAPE